MTYDITKGKPIPEPYTNRPKSALKIAMEQMTVGDSMEITRNDYDRSPLLARRLGIKITLRKIGETFWVWRVK